MTEEHINELFIQYKKTGDVEIRNQIAEKYMYIADILAKKFVGRGVEYDDLTAKTQEESSCSVKERTDRARKIQRERFVGTSINTNAEMHEKQLKEYCVLSEECESVLKEAFDSLRLSARARSRIIKVARTIADLEGVDDISTAHIAEAINYRTLDRDNWVR
jgi:magnesium chelatase family protein